MKKTLCWLLAILMIQGLVSPVYADELSSKDVATILTAEVPEPTYTAHIPENQNLTYGNTSRQDIGMVYITDAVGFLDDDYIRCVIGGTDLVYSDTEAGVADIPMNVYLDGNPVFDSEVSSMEFLIWDHDETPRKGNVSVQISSWKDAVPGVYQGKVTFKFRVMRPKF